MQKKKSKRMTGFGLLVVLVVALCGAVIYASAGLKKERDDKLAKKQELESQIAVQKEEAERLELQKEYVGTRKFTEEIAKKVLGLVYPEDIVFEEKTEE